MNAHAWHGMAYLEPWKGEAWVVKDLDPLSSIPNSQVIDAAFSKIDLLKFC
jgi:hypothetical protein